MQMSRKKAIKYIWKLAGDHGFDSDRVHELLGGLCSLKLIRHPGISKLSSFELSRVLHHIFKVKVYVKDERMDGYIKSFCKKSPGNMEFLKGVLRRYKKESLYQLSDDQKRFLLGYFKKIDQNEGDKHVIKKSSRRLEKSSKQAPASLSGIGQ